MGFSKSSQILVIDVAAEFCCSVNLEVNKFSGRPEFRTYSSKLKDASQPACAGSRYREVENNFVQPILAEVNHFSSICPGVTSHYSRYG